MALKLCFGKELEKGKLFCKNQVGQVWSAWRAIWGGGDVERQRGWKMERQASEMELGQGAAWANTLGDCYQWWGCPTELCRAWIADTEFISSLHFCKVSHHTVAPNLQSVHRQRSCMNDFVSVSWRRSDSWVLHWHGTEVNQALLCVSWRGDPPNEPLIGSRSQSHRNPGEATLETWGMPRGVSTNPCKLGYTYGGNE